MRPGWNAQDEPVGPVPYDFRSGCFDDYKRYWPEAASCGAGEPARPIFNEPVIYQLKAGGKRYQRAD